MPVFWRKSRDNSKDEYDWRIIEGAGVARKSRDNSKAVDPAVLGVAGHPRKSRDNSKIIVISEVRHKHFDVDRESQETIASAAVQPP